MFILIEKTNYLVEMNITLNNTIFGDVAILNLF
jgi:hypothetical protein